MDDIFNRLVTYLKDYNVYKITKLDLSLNENTIVLKESPEILNVYSISKSIISFGIGILYDRGLLKLDSKLTEILKDEINFEYVKKWDNVTIKSLLDQTPGYKSPKLMGLDKYKVDKDWLKYSLNLKLEYGIEKRFQYSNVSFYLLGRVIEKLSNTSVDEFFNKYLFSDLDFKGHAIGKSPLNHACGSTDMFFNSSDLAKFGVLYANDGIYNNKRILSHEWVELTYKTHSSEKLKEYTLGFWKDPASNEIYADGANGQYIFIFKGKGAIAIQSYDNLLKVENIIENCLRS